MKRRIGVAALGLALVSSALLGGRSPPPAPPDKNHPLASAAHAPRVPPAAPNHPPWGPGASSSLPTTAARPEAAPSRLRPDPDPDPAPPAPDQARVDPNNRHRKAQLPPHNIAAVQPPHPSTPLLHHLRLPGSGGSAVDSTAGTTPPLVVFLLLLITTASGNGLRPTPPPGRPSTTAARAGGGLLNGEPHGLGWRHAAPHHNAGASPRAPHRSPTGPPQRWPREAPRATARLEPDKGVSPHLEPGHDQHRREVRRHLRADLRGEPARTLRLYPRCRAQRGVDRHRVPAEDHVVALTVVTANVNGIRAASRRGGLRWLAEAGADVVCLQEVRATDEQLHETLAESELRDWHVSHARRPSSGGRAWRS